MFEIIDERNKRIVISIHLEAIYTDIQKKDRFDYSKSLFKTNTLDKSHVEDLVSINIKNDEGYEYIIDFSYIKYVVDNYKKKLIEWLSDMKKKKICHCQECELWGELERKKIEDNSIDYEMEFESYGMKYIKDKCCNPEGYTSQIGVHLGVYIDIKKIIMDSVNMLQWCYIIAYKLESANKNKDKKSKKLLFCHTLNGAYIAGILSQLLGYDLLYVNHLGPYNKLNKIDVVKDKTHLEEFIIVADMVCQGNEFLRAKNIMEYNGGSVCGCVGIVKMDISKVLEKYNSNAFAVTYTPDAARSELGYTIRTVLCQKQCDECIGKEK